MKENYNIIYGVHSVLESIKSENKLYKIFILKKNNFNENIKKIIFLSKRFKIPIIIVYKKKFLIKHNVNHQGVFAFSKKIDFFKIKNLLPSIYKNNKIPLLLILDRITDVRNFGNILRTSVCMGVDAVLIPFKNSVSINSDTVKSSSGAIFNIPICKENNLYKTIIFIKSFGLKIFSLTEKCDNYFFKEKFNIPMALILGNENNGISKELIEVSDKKITIPMYNNNIKSLNVSTACSIALYEIFKQKN